MLKLYDSKTATEQIVQGELITIYLCGPTVYNDIHIGNLRPVITFDVLVRFLRKLNHQVVYVHNLTDIDDKIIAQAAKLQCSEAIVAKRYIAAYLEILKVMNVETPDHMPQVVDNITNIQAYIEQLINTKTAYVVNGNVWFKVKAIANYGSLSKQNIAELQSQSLQVINDFKQDSLDFALWKQTHEGVQWNSPWGLGRPGWHTECAYFINHYFGKQVVIHGGGLDLKFPHHENENAQNYALYKCDLAKIWMHTGTITLNQVKMSKSLNNFVLVKDLLNKYAPNVLRWFYFQTHYQKPLEFSKVQLEKAANELMGVLRAIHQARTFLVTLKKQLDFKATQLKTAFIATLNDDLNFPNMLQEMHALKTQLNKFVKSQDAKAVQTALNVLLTHLATIGIVVPFLHNQAVIEIIHQWQKALQNHNYKQADQLRSQLISLECW